MQEVQAVHVPPVRDQGPSRAAGPAEVVRDARPVGGAGADEDTVELRPSPARVVGPGRKERAYQARIAALEGDLEQLDRRGEELEASLEVAQLVERGTGRLVDRMELQAAATRAEAEKARQQANRLLVALGALQAENEQLRGRLATAVRGLPEASGTVGRRGWRRWFAR